MVAKKPTLIRASVLNRNANGLFFNTPSLGAELFANTGFGADTNWTKGSGWTIAGGVGVGTATSLSITQSVGTLNRLVLFSYDLVSRTLGTVNQNAPTATAQSAPGTYPSEGWKTAAAIGITGASFTGTIDNCSLKQYTHSECFVLADGFTPYRSLIGYLPAAPNNSHLALIGLCDRLDSPLSYLRVLYTIDSAGSPLLGLAKFVSDTRTTLIGSTAITFVANAPIELRRLPGTNTFQLWYNNVQVGTDQTVSDSVIVNNTLYGFVGLSNLALLSDVQLDGMSIF